MPNSPTKPDVGKVDSTILSPPSPSSSRQSSCSRGDQHTRSLNTATGNGRDLNKARNDGKLEKPPPAPGAAAGDRARGSEEQDKNRTTWAKQESSSQHPPPPPPPTRTPSSSPSRPSSSLFRPKILSWIPLSWLTITLGLLTVFPRLIFHFGFMAVGLVAGSVVTILYFRWREDPVLRDRSFWDLFTESPQRMMDELRRTVERAHVTIESRKTTSRGMSTAVPSLTIPFHAIPAPVKSSLTKLIDYIVRDFVESWYAGLNVTRSPEFQIKVQQNLQVVFGNVATVLGSEQTFEPPLLLSHAISNSLMIHLKEWRKFEMVGRDWVRFRNEYGGGLASLERKRRDWKMRGMADVMIQTLLAGEEQRSGMVVAFLREVMVSAVLKPVVGVMSDPWWLTTFVTYMTSESPPGEEKPVGSHAEPPSVITKKDQQGLDDLPTPQNAATGLPQVAAIYVALIRGTRVRIPDGGLLYCMLSVATQQYSTKKTKGVDGNYIFNEQFVWQVNDFPKQRDTDGVIIDLCAETQSTAKILGSIYVGFANFPANGCLQVWFPLDTVGEGSMEDSGATRLLLEIVYTDIHDRPPAMLFQEESLQVQDDGKREKVNASTPPVQGPSAGAGVEYATKPVSPLPKCSSSVGSSGAALPEEHSDSPSTRKVSQEETTPNTPSSAPPSHIRVSSATNPNDPSAIAPTKNQESGPIPDGTTGEEDSNPVEGLGSMPAAHVEAAPTLDMELNHEKLKIDTTCMTTTAATSTSAREPAVNDACECDTPASSHQDPSQKPSPVNNPIGRKNSPSPTSSGTSTLPHAGLSTTQQFRQILKEDEAFAATFSRYLSQRSRLMLRLKPSQRPDPDKIPLPLPPYVQFLKQALVYESILLRGFESHTGSQDLRHIPWELFNMYFKEEAPLHIPKVPRELILQVEECISSGQARRGQSELEPLINYTAALLVGNFLEGYLAEDVGKLWRDRITLGLDDDSVPRQQFRFSAPPTKPVRKSMSVSDPSSLRDISDKSPKGKSEQRQADEAFRAIQALISAITALREQRLVLSSKPEFGSSAEVQSNLDAIDRKISHFERIIRYKTTGDDALEGREFVDYGRAKVRLSGNVSESRKMAGTANSNPGFMIEIENEGIGWMVPRNYSDFSALHRGLQTTFPKIAKVKLPPPPPKMPLPNLMHSRSQDFNKVRIGLERFLHLLIMDDVLMCCEEVQDFLRSTAIDMHGDVKDKQGVGKRMSDAFQTVGKAVSRVPIGISSQISSAFSLPAANSSSTETSPSHGPRKRTTATEGITHSRTAPDLEEVGISRTSIGDAAIDATKALAGRVGDTFKRVTSANATRDLFESPELRPHQLQVEEEKVQFGRRSPSPSTRERSTSSSNLQGLPTDSANRTWRGADNPPMDGDCEKLGPPRSKPEKARKLRRSSSVSHAVTVQKPDTRLDLRASLPKAVNPGSKAPSISPNVAATPAVDSVPEEERTLSQRDVDLLYENIFSVTEEVFDLTSSSSRYFRRRLFLFMKQLLRQTYSRQTISDYYVTLYNAWTKPESIKGWIDMGLDSLWPKGEWRTEPEPFEHLDKGTIQAELSKMMPEGLKRMIGKGRSVEGVDSLVDMFFDRDFAESFWVLVLDTIVKLVLI